MEEIRFENLRQASSVVGVAEAEIVKAKLKPFVAANAPGILCKVRGREDVSALAAAAGKKTLAMLSS